MKGPALQVVDWSNFKLLDTVINKKRLEKAKAYKEEEANHYFSSIAPLTKLFVVD